MTAGRTARAAGAVLALLLACLPPARVAAQQRAAGVVRGTVTQARDGLPVDRAIVGAVAVRAATRTDAAGRFLLAVPAGPVTLRVRALGFASAERLVAVRPGETTTVAFTLEPVPLRLDAVRTTATPREREAFDRVPEVGTFGIRGSVLRSVPMLGEPDVLRTVQLLPGVVARNDYTAGYNVRGGESDQNLILLDGIPVYNPFHLGGLFGTFLDETVADVTLLTGGFPASYGGRLSSVLDVTTADEARQGVHGGASISLLSSSAALAGMLPDARTSWSIAGRRTYADALASLISDDGLPYYFYDGQVKLRHLLRRGGTLSFTAYGGRDALDGSFSQFDGTDEAPSDQGSFLFDWGNRLAGLAFIQPLAPGSAIPLGAGQQIALGDSARLELRASVTEFTTGLDLGAGAFRLDNRVSEMRGSGMLAWYVGTHARRVGAEVSRLRVRYDAEAEDAGIPLLGLSQRPWALSAYLDETWRMSARWLVRYGARVEHVTDANWTGVSPRAAIRYFATPDMAFTLAGGRYAQWMHSLANEDVPVRVFDAWVASDRFVPVSLAEHAVLGVERWLDDRRFVKLEGWGKLYHDIPEANEADDPVVRGDEFVYREGTSYGADLLLRQLEGGTLGGWIAYGYAVSARTRDGRTYAPAQDRRHNVNAVATWRLPRRWQLAGRIGYGSGTPYTGIEGQVVRRIYNAATGTFDTGIADRQIEPVGGSRNGSRYPYFARFDITASRTYAYRGATLMPYLSVINATNQRNVFTYVYDYTDNPPTQTAYSQFPILPTLGLSVQF